jgi:hypothetical protein
MQAAALLDRRAGDLFCENDETPACCVTGVSNVDATGLGKAGVRYCVLQLFIESYRGVIK